MHTTGRTALLGALFLMMVLVPAGVGAQKQAAPIAFSVWAATAGGAETEFWLILREQADLSPAASLPSKEAKGRFVWESLRATAQHTQAPLRVALAEQGAPHRSFFIVNALLVTGDRALVEAMAQRPEVARIVANPTLRAALPPLEKGTKEGAGTRAPGLPDNLLAIHADVAWAMGVTGEGIVIGGQDTGYQWDHPALVQQYRGWDGTSASHDYNWHDSIHEGTNNPCGIDAPAPCDDLGHGTHTIGTAVGSDGGENQIGVAPGAQWIGCRNMERGNGTPATYLECFEFFLAPYPVGGTPDEGRPELAPHVTLNSWACTPSEGCDGSNLSILEAAVNAQEAAGILTVVSAGNSGAQGCSSVTTPPALYANSYTVGALVTGSTTLASFSSRGPVTVDGSGRAKPDLVAPGTSIRSAGPADAYYVSNGTSMAAPHVAGGAALTLAAAPALVGDPVAIRALLNESATPIPTAECGSTPATNHLFGHGQLNLEAALWQLRATEQRFFPLILR